MSYPDPEKRKAYYRSYRKRNLEKCRKWSRDWKKKHYDKWKDQAKKYRKSHPEKIKAYREKYKKLGKTKLSQIKSRYGITQKDVKNIIQIQGGKCPICKKSFSETVGCIDHDHKTKKVRGVIHRKCNLLIGYANEDINILQNAISYLELNQQEKTK